MAHNFSMPGDFVERVVGRQGRPHTVEEIDGPSTALVVVDMQNYFMVDPYAGAAPVAVDIVPTVNRLAAAVRAGGGSVIWFRMTAPRQTDSGWSSVRELYSEAAAAARWQSLQPDDPGSALHPDLDVRDRDTVVVKERYSAFIPGSSNIVDVLQANGVTTLLIAGVATNVCCESTARDAMMLNYRVVMISDACAAKTDAEHAAALGNFYLFFGDVQTTDEIIAHLVPSR